MIVKEWILFFLDMSNILLHPDDDASREYVNNLLGRIEFYVIPKKFDKKSNQDNQPISNTIQRNKKMNTVNFFINAPLEIYIFDCLWTIWAAKMDYDKSILSYDIYGNTINKSAMFSENEINFENNRLFNRYFNRYTAWRNKAFKTMERNYINKKDSILISLDIKSYFYSVAFSFESLNHYFENHELLIRIKPLTNLLAKVYAQYFHVISPYRKDLSHLEKEEYPLPIGLFSSMLLANIYLSSFDRSIKMLKGIKYYGRYVDDILIVINKKIDPEKSNQEIIDALFVKPGIFKKEGPFYSFSGYKSLFVQTDKIKIIYMDHKESRALVDIYNHTIRIKPSQMDPLPSSYLDLDDFDETAYSIENFKKENKIRDIGFLGIDSFKVGRFFSLLPRKYANINLWQTDIDKDIAHQIEQIEKFFTGSQTIEYYSNWLNYMYFLVLTKRNKQLHTFISSTKAQILALQYTALDKTIYKKTSSINRLAKETLEQHLAICLRIALSIDSDYAKKHFNAQYEPIKKYIESNMFDHYYVAFPLANYLEYSDYISFHKMSLCNMGQFPTDITQSFKFIWSPRFIHYDELLLLLFYHYHKNNNSNSSFNYVKERLTEKFTVVNHLTHHSFDLKSQNIYENDDYVLEEIELPSSNIDPPKTVNVAVGSIDITEDQCIQGCERWFNLTKENKEMFFDILKQSYTNFKEKKDRPAILVLPELCFPIYWISDLISFSKRTQIAIVTGLQYLGDNSNRKYNYLATILPFTNGSLGYKNAFIHIREKNDYSPIEIEALATKGYVCCKSREMAEYQVFYWKGIRISPIVCFELTDIMARAILKGNSDILALSVFNSDTTYFSNIIDSAVRDLHAFIIQANTSHLGDSRITGPYDRDSKDIFKIKGGENDHVVTGTIEFKKLKDYQEGYDKQQSLKLQYIEETRKKKNKNNTVNPKTKPDIKRLPARYKCKKH